MKDIERNWKNEWKGGEGLEREKIRREIGIINVREKKGKKKSGLIVEGNLVMEWDIGKGGIRELKREGEGEKNLERMSLIYG